jgi:imidazolonepropionase
MKIDNLKAGDLVIINANIASMDASIDRPYGMIDNASIVIRNQTIEWVGKNLDLSKSLPAAVEVIDAKNKLVTPGLIDCHSHLVFGGNRANEFAMRLEGASYEAIAKAGGGIVSTVNATRAASEDTLFESASKRLQQLLAEGVTTIEIKSGYGLDLETELKMLRVAKRLQDSYSVEVSCTFLGAHALPPEYKDQPDAYIDLVCDQMVPIIASQKLADCVDVFCENIGFNAAQTERVFAAAAAHGLPVKLHAEQLSNQGGTQLAIKHDAWSVDHLEFIDQKDVDALSTSNTVPVLLPGAFYCLRETQLPPLQSMFAAQLPIALATDANPGSSPCLSLLLVMSMACTLFRFTPEQALRGVTFNAAKALRRDSKVGSIAIGKQADIVIWDLKEAAELAYYFGSKPAHITIKKGHVIEPIVL